jgi:hypothetical protein
MENLFDLELPAPKRKGASDDAPAARLAAVDTVDALAAFVVDGIKAEKPAVDAAGLLHFTGISARGYGAVSFPAAEALAFASALVALSKGEAVTASITLASMCDGGRKASMLENLVNAEPYVGADGSVIALKVAGSNHECSAKPKATLVSVNPTALRALAFYVASAAAKADKANADAYAGIQRATLTEGKTLRERMQVHAAK